MPLLSCCFVHSVRHGHNYEEIFKSHCSTTDSFTILTGPYRFLGSGAFGQEGAQGHVGRHRAQYRLSFKSRHRP